MKIVLATYSSDRDYNADCDYALVAIGKPEAETLLGYINKAAEIQEDIGSHFCALEVFDYRCDYFEYHDGVDALAFNERIAVASDDFEVPDAFAQRTECDTASVGPMNIHWTAIPKYTGISIETPAISAWMLKRIFDGETTLWE